MAAMCHRRRSSMESNKTRPTQSVHRRRPPCFAYKHRSLLLGLSIMSLRVGGRTFLFFTTRAVFQPDFRTSNWTMFGAPSETHSGLCLTHSMFASLQTPPHAGKASGQTLKQRGIGMELAYLQLCPFGRSYRLGTQARALVSFSKLTRPAAFLLAWLAEPSS